MKTQTKNQNGGWVGRAQRKQQAGYLKNIAKVNKGKNLLSSVKVNEANKSQPDAK